MSSFLKHGSTFYSLQFLSNEYMNFCSIAHLIDLKIIIIMNRSSYTNKVSNNICVFVVMGHLNIMYLRIQLSQCLPTL